MEVDYQQSESVLKMLNYSSCDIKTILDTLKKGNFSYMKCPKESNQWNETTCSGIDVPALWIPKTEKSKKTIFLLAQDPLRNENYWDLCEDESVRCNKRSHVIIGTPYALHIKDEHRKRLNLNIGIYRKLIERMVEGELQCQVYCTDVFKYYPNDKRISDIDIKMLKEEIKKVRPNLYLCMGKSAQKAIDIIKIDRIKEGISEDSIIRTPHFRARADSWKNITKKYDDDSKVSSIIELMKTRI